MNKVKVLFVVSEFFQAGCQRYTYEIDSAINREKFEITILSLLPLNSNKMWEDYYYQKHLQLGTKIYFLDEINVPYQPTIKERINRKLFNKPLPSIHSNLHNFLDKFDAISFMGEYNYAFLEGKITPAHKAKTLIHIQNSRLQNPDNYIKYNKYENYHFVSGFNKNDIIRELAEFSNYKHTFFPICFNVKSENFKCKFIDSQKKKIGIFTRLTYTKPLNPFLDAFQLLVQKYPDVELHLFGTGDPVKEGVAEYVNRLNLTDKVFYRGHQKDIVETALNENLSLVWLHGYHGVPGGFAGYDICTTGIPQIFWEFGSAPVDGVNESFPMYKTKEEMAQKSFQLLTDKVAASALSKLQFDFVCEHNNISKFIQSLEQLYAQVSKQ